jgi:hypothetical protein
MCTTPFVHLMSGITIFAGAWFRYFYCKVPFANALYVSVPPVIAVKGFALRWIYLFLLHGLIKLLLLLEQTATFCRHLSQRQHLLSINCEIVWSDVSLTHIYNAATNVSSGFEYSSTSYSLRWCNNVSACSKITFYMYCTITSCYVSINFRTVDI